MVAWFQQEKYYELYQHCRERGAPQFNSPAEMAKWIRLHYKSLKTTVVDSLEPVIELVTGVNTKLFRAVRRFLSRLQRRLRAQGKNRFTIKAFVTPLRLNPHSLHPIGATC
jgi:hypothetical protein